jgi:hypothetical protein
LLTGISRLLHDGEAALLGEYQHAPDRKYWEIGGVVDPDSFESGYGSVSSISNDIFL